MARTAVLNEMWVRGSPLLPISPSTDGEAAARDARAEQPEVVTSLNYKGRNKGDCRDTLLQPL